MKIVSTKPYKSNFRKNKKDKIEVTIDMTLEMFSLFKEVFENPTPKTLLKVAVLLNKDSGNPYRDAVTDLLHLAIKGKPDVDLKLHLEILSSAWDIYHEEKEEEKEELERTFIEKIKKKDLPLYMNKEWKFEENKILYLQRLSFERKRESNA